MPALIVAQGGNQARAWQHWTDPRLRPWSATTGWLHELDAQALARVFELMWRPWQDPALRPLLEAGVALLMDASEESVNLESRVVLAQAGLERFAWQRLAVEGRWTEAKFDKKSTAQRIRALNSASGVSPALGPRLSSLSRQPDLRDRHGRLPVDGPSFVVAVRNRTAHPPRELAAFLPSDVVIGAWRLSLEYLQLAILGWLGYSGPVVSPVAGQRHGFP
jgi:hypothetical protein